LQKGVKAFLRELDQYTLADLVAPERALAGLLSLEPPPRARSESGKTRKRT
jgi:hypothetical protein